MESHRSDALGVQPPRHRPASAKHAMRSAGTRADTISLLAWAAGQVEERRAEADRWREPRPDRRGLLVADDDAHEVLADPTAADLAARVAIGGPVVGIGLVAVIESVGPDTVAARRDLLLALGETNAFLFDQRQLQLWRALRDGDALRKGCGLWAVEDVVRAHAPPGHVRLAGPQLGTMLERCPPVRGPGHLPDPGGGLHPLDPQTGTEPTSLEVDDELGDHRRLERCRCWVVSFFRSCMQRGVRENVGMCDAPG